MTKLTIAAISSGLTALLGAASDLVPLLQYAAQAMDIVEATSTAAGDDKKTQVLNMVGVVAATAGKDISAVETTIGSFIDAAKAAYNAGVVAVQATEAAIAGIAAEVKTPAPIAPQPAS